MQTTSAPFVLIPLCVNDARSAREHLFGVPPVADLLTLVGRPCEAAVAPTVVAIPEQVSVMHDGVNDMVWARELLFVVSPFADLLTLVGRPCEAAVAPTVVAIPKQVAVVHDGVNDALHCCL